MLLLEEDSGGHDSAGMGVMMMQEAMFREMEYILEYQDVMNVPNNYDPDVLEHHRPNFWFRYIPLQTMILGPPHESLSMTHAYCPHFFSIACPCNGKKFSNGFF